MGKKGKEKEPTTYKRLIKGSEECESTAKSRKGYIPVLVGRDSAVERLLVHVNLFKDPCIVVLLEMAADELGEQPEGLLRIPCDIEHFRQVVGVISRTR